MFWRLGLISAWRNLARSMLAVLSMALAAGFLTNAISFSRGYAGLMKADYRSILGGEIVAYAPQLSGTAPEDDALWHYRRLVDVQNTDLEFFHPELLRQGYLSTLEQPIALDEERVAAIAALPEIEGVYPRYQFPAYTQGDSAIWTTPLRGRDAMLDLRQALHPAELLCEGRWFYEEDEGELVAVVSSRQHYPLGQRMAAVGDTLQVMLPRIVEQDDSISYDFTAAQIVELKVVGVIDIHSRSIDYSVTGGTGQTVSLTLDLYAQFDEIQLPLTTWQKLWELAGGGEYRPQQLGLMIEDMSNLEDIVTTLRGRFPEHTFYGVPELTQQAEVRLLVENPLLILLNSSLVDRATNLQTVTQSGMALDLRLPMSILIFINAALIMAANLMIMVNERRTEIGILKAVGAMRRQVVTMVLAEALLISTLGAVVGFLFFRLPALFNQLTNGVALGVLLGSLAFDLVVVFGATITATLLFGMLPALMMARLSVQEVLQSE